MAVEHVQDGKPDRPPQEANDEPAQKKEMEDARVEDAPEDLGAEMPEGVHNDGESDGEDEAWEAVEREEGMEEMNGGRGWFW